MTTSVSKLGNGLKNCYRSMPHATTISIGIWVNVGARDEQDHEQNIAHMLSIWLLRVQNGVLRHRH